MKKGFFIAFILLSSSLLIFGCRHSAGSGSGDGSLLFNVGELNALAIAKGDGNRSSRNATTDGMIVKILADGSVENFISLPDGASLSPVNFIARSPSSNASEIYIVFTNTSWWSEGYGSSYNSYSLGQLVCVKDDGSYIDVLKKDDGDYKWLYNSSSQDSIAFDEVGGMYYLVSEGNGNSNTNMIYKFNPTTGESGVLTQAIQNTYYDKMQVSKDGAWIFTKANRWSNDNNNNTSYLRAIPTANPQDFINIFYSSGNNSWLNDWCYDDDNQTFYYIMDGTLFAVKLENGTFNKDNRVALFGNSNNSGDTWFDNGDIFSWSNGQIITWRGCNEIYNSNNNHTYYFRNPDSLKSEVQPQEILDYLYARACDSLNVSWDDWVSTEKDKYEIRFDKFENVSGYEVLATITKGKSDLELIKALVDNNIEETLYNLLESNYSSNPDGWYACNQFFSNFYDHNFFADVLYLKGTNTNISSDLFIKQTWGGTTKFASMGLENYNLLQTSWGNGIKWKKDFYEGNDLDPAKVLECFASYCGRSASEIDFSLECFKNDKKYSMLYTDLKNEEAITFLNTTAKMQKLNDYLNDDDLYDRNSNGAAHFLLNTCFKKGTKDSAYFWRSSNGNNGSIWWGNVNKLTPSYQKSLYGVFSGNSNGLIKILDKDGNPFGTFEGELNSYKITDIVSAPNGFYFKRALLDNADEESGYHQIMYYDVVNSTCTNYFDKVSDNTSLEVISFSAGSDCVYYSAAKGFDIINGKIDLKTKAVTILSSNTKLTQIITIK